MKLAIISGSQRSDSNTRKAGRLIESILGKKSETETYLLELNDHPLPLWDENAGIQGSESWKKWQPVKKELDSCHGFVILSPEWHGMVPAALKNFFLYCGTPQMGHKPALIVSVSAGIGGSYPVSELRASSYKNNRICYIPDHVILRNVSDFLKHYESPENDIQRHLKERLLYSLDLLKAYATSLSSLRESGVVNTTDFANGM